MKVVSAGAEHKFLKFLDRVKADPTGWVACTFPFSRRVKAQSLLDDRTEIGKTLKEYRSESLEFLKKAHDVLASMPHAEIFHFSDNDILLFSCAKTEEEQMIIHDGVHAISAMFEKNFVDFGFLTDEFQVFQKLADHKILTQKRIEIYERLSDDEAIESLSIRRKKRDEPVILVVEDDRFTAAYLTNFLKDFDVVVARNGEEAVRKYIDYAPDAVFLDIHLPGMNGHDVLRAIKCADPEAFVVMLSVDTAQTSILKASENGAASYLKKPLSRERILNTLRLSPYIRETHGLLPIYMGR